MDDLDLLAMISLLGLLARNGYSNNLPAQAYDVAEAMLREREKRNGS